MEFRFLLNPTIGGITSRGRGRNGHTPRMRRHRVQRYVILILFSIPDLGSEDCGFYSGLPPLDPSSAGVKRFFFLFFLIFLLSMTFSFFSSDRGEFVLTPLLLLTPPETWDNLMIGETLYLYDHLHDRIKVSRRNKLALLVGGVLGEGGCSSPMWIFSMTKYEG